MPLGQLAPQAVAAAEPRRPRRPLAGRHRGSHCPSGTGTPAPGPGPGDSDTVTGDSGSATGLAGQQVTCLRPLVTIRGTGTAAEHSD